MALNNQVLLIQLKIWTEHALSEFWVQMSIKVVVCEAEDAVFQHKALCYRPQGPSLCIADRRRRRLGERVCPRTCVCVGTARNLPLQLAGGGSQKLKIKAREKSAGASLISLMTLARVHLRECKVCVVRPPLFQEKW